METIDKLYTPELNFIDELSLSRNGMIREIEIEFNIIRLCLQESLNLDPKYLPMLNRILVMPLRKLLCENNSVLLNVCADFKMPKLSGFPLTLEGEETIIRPPYRMGKFKDWILVKDWLKQEIAWFNRKQEIAPQYIPELTYNGIMKKLNGRKHESNRKIFETVYQKMKVKYKGDIIEMYCNTTPFDSNMNKNIYNILDEIGYNKLPIYDFIKHMSDKRGAHIDVGHSLVVEMVNENIGNGLNPIHCFAIQMIIAAKKQIPELNNYWPEMPEFTDLED